MPVRVSSLPGRARSGRTPFLLVGLLVLLPAVLLVALGVRTLAQDTRLAEAQARERLDRAAALAAQDLERGLGRWDRAVAEVVVKSRRRGSLCAAAHQRGPRQGSRRRSRQGRNPAERPPRRSPALHTRIPSPRASSVPARPPAALEAGEILEIQKQDYARAAQAYRALLESADASVRPLALQRLARTEAKAGRLREALRLYEALERETGAMIGDLPADLVGSVQRCELIAASGTPAELDPRGIDLLPVAHERPVARGETALSPLLGAGAPMACRRVRGGAPGDRRRGSDRAAEDPAERGGRRGHERDPTSRRSGRRPSALHARRQPVPGLLATAGGRRRCDPCRAGRDEPACSRMAGPCLGRWFGGHRHLAGGARRHAGLCHPWSLWHRCRDDVPRADVSGRRLPLAGARDRRTPRRAVRGGDPAAVAVRCHAGGHGGRPAGGRPHRGEDAQAGSRGRPPQVAVRLGRLARVPVAADRHLAAVRAVVRRQGRGRSPAPAGTTT